MSSITVTSQANIAIENHKITTGQYWEDPVYQAIAAKRIEGETCHYCEVRPATLAHHDNSRSYHSKAEYYDPKNMTPACGVCHEQYRKGLVICPVCRKHYMKRTSEKCGHCRGDIPIMHNGRLKWRKPRLNEFPCGHRISRQRCQRDGHLYVCGRSAKDAEGCDYYKARSVTHDLL